MSPDFTASSLPILRPAAVLVAWTLLMLCWTFIVRLRAMRGAGVELGKLVGTKASDADRALPPQAQWKAHNYNHLVEQPTLFYALCGILALTGAGHGINAGLAWAYVALRIVHSLWQALVNRVAIRLYLFMASTLMLVAMSLHALMTVF